MMTTRGGQTTLVDLDQCIDPDKLVPAYQPIVDLDSGATVGYEALARWPSLPDLNPVAVFHAARASGRLTDLEWACRKAAVNGALSSGLNNGSILFVNFDPRVVDLPGGAETLWLFAEAQTRFQVIAELTETDLLADPPRLFKLVSWLRKIGWGVALDDVGAHPGSLALLPIIAPDVIKLDLSLVQNQPTVERARIAGAVMAHAEQTSAIVLAEGIENQAHLEQAHALGATLGQGWLFGRPRSIADQPMTATGQVPVPRPDVTAERTPFALVDQGIPARIGNRSLLRALSEHIESNVFTQPDAVVLLATFQHSDFFTPMIAQRYAELAQRSPFVLTLACRMSPAPVSGVHGIALFENDPLCDEWTVVAIGAHYSAALIARHLGVDDRSMDGRYRFIVTHNRRLVVKAAQALLSRTQPRFR